METVSSTLTVFFEEPYWVGVYEIEYAGTYQACKILFGAEPTDRQVYDFLHQHRGRLCFSPALEAAAAAPRRINPKRMQRAISSRLQGGGVGTKAQQALKLQHEQGKQARAQRSRAEKQAAEQRRFALRQEKRKAKRRGR